MFKKVISKLLVLLLFVSNIFPAVRDTSVRAEQSVDVIAEQILKALNENKLEELGKLLSSNREYINFKYAPDNATLLMKASEKNNIAAVNLLVNLGADIHVCNKENQSAITLALKNNYLLIAGMLISFVAPKVIGTTDKVEESEPIPLAPRIEPLKDLIFTCQEKGCGKKFNSKLGFSMHLINKHEKDAIKEGKVAEENAEKSEPTPLAPRIEPSLLSIEPAAGKFTCTEKDCGRDFTTEKGLNRHLASHNNSQKKNDKGRIVKECSHCGIELSQANFRRHERLHTLIVGGSICDVGSCGSNPPRSYTYFKDRKKLSNHQMKSHKKEEQIKIKSSSKVVRKKRKIEDESQKEKSEKEKKTKVAENAEESVTIPFIEPIPLESSDSKMAREIQVPSSDGQLLPREESSLIGQSRVYTTLTLPSTSTLPDLPLPDLLELLDLPLPPSVIESSYSDNERSQREENADESEAIPLESSDSKISEETQATSSDKFICPEEGCGKNFVSDKKLKDHLRYHKRQIIPCRHCGIQLHESNVSRHETFHTPFETDFICKEGICGSKPPHSYRYFKTKESLNSHQGKKNKNQEKNAKGRIVKECKVCGKKVESRIFSTHKKRCEKKFRKKQLEREESKEEMEEQNDLPGETLIAGSFSETRLLPVLAELPDTSELPAILPGFPMPPDLPVGTSEELPESNLFSTPVNLQLQEPSLETEPLPSLVGTLEFPGTSSQASELPVSPGLPDTSELPELLPEFPMQPDLPVGTSEEIPGSNLFDIPDNSQLQEQLSEPLPSLVGTLEFPEPSSEPLQSDSRAETSEFLDIPVPSSIIDAKYSDFADYNLISDREL